MLCFLDDGCGMDPEQCGKNLYSGEKYRNSSEKIEYIGKYGYGLYTNKQ